MTIPADALAADPVDQFDRRWHDRGYHRESVRRQLAPVPWRDGATIGELLDDRCKASRLGQRCERKAEHEGHHACDSGNIQWNNERRWRTGGRGW